MCAYRLTQSSLIYFIFNTTNDRCFSALFTIDFDCLFIGKSQTEESNAESTRRYIPRRIIVVSNWHQPRNGDNERFAYNLWYICQIIITDILVSPENRPMYTANNTCVTDIRYNWNRFNRTVSSLRLFFINEMLPLSLRQCHAAFITRYRAIY